MNSEEQRWLLLRGAAGPVLKQILFAIYDYIKKAPAIRSSFYNVEPIGVLYI